MSIENALERKNKFKEIKKDCYNYVISVPEKEINNIASKSYVLNPYRYFNNKNFTKLTSITWSSFKSL